MSFLTANMNSQMDIIDHALNSGDLKALFRLMDCIIPGSGQRIRNQAAVDHKAAIAAARREVEAQKRAAADAELRLDVIDEMVASGVARHVAANMTNTTAKMLEQGRAYGVI